MSKLHFRYGTMGSSKTAQLLMVKFNYEEKGRRVWLIKPETDTRDGRTIIRSRIGLSAEAEVVKADGDILEMFKKKSGKIDVVIVDEAQFLSACQILQLRKIVSLFNVPVLCFGLRTDFQSKLFPGSKALFELADEIEEIRSICRCGAKATVNARLDKSGTVTTNGNQVELGGNDKYESMCWKCYAKALGIIKEEHENETM